MGILWTKYGILCKIMKKGMREIETDGNKDLKNSKIQFNNIKMIEPG